MKIKLCNPIFILLLILSINACDSFKPVRKTPQRPSTTNGDEYIEVYNPQTGRMERKRRSEIDNNPNKPKPQNPTTPPSNTTDNPPTTKPNTSTSYKKNVYNITYLLPFSAMNNDPQTGNSKWALNFWAGANIALDLLKDEAIKLNVNVLDTKTEDADMQKLLSNPAVKNADVLVGPYKKSQATILADYAKSENKILFSPYIASNEVTTNNPNYIQCTPSLQSHCDGIMHYVLKNYDDDEIILISRNKSSELAAIDQCQLSYYKKRGSSSAKLKQMILDDNSDAIWKTDFSNFIKPNRTTAVVVPIWSSEQFVYALMRKLDALQSKNTKIVLFGLPQWMDFEKVEYDYFSRLQVHVSSGYYIDNESVTVKAFQQQFFEKTQAPPTTEAFMGYDATLYLGTFLSYHGLDFKGNLEKEKARGIHTSFNFERTSKQAALELNPVDYFENKKIFILKYDNFLFAPVE